MRRPRRWRTIAVGAAIGGSLLGALAFLAPSWVGDAPRTAAFAIGLSAVLFGIVGAWVAHGAARAEDVLARGEDVIARWRVDAASWRAFVAADDRRGAASGLPNEFSRGGPVPAEGIEVVVGRDAIRIDDSVHPLPRHGAPEVLSAALIDGEPDVVELTLLHPGYGGGASGVPRGPSRSALRFPAGSPRDAHGVVSYYSRGRPAPADFFHGPGDGSDPEDLGTCLDCGYESHDFRSVCPRCGGPVMSRRWSRRSGRILAVLGAALTIGLSGLLITIGPLLLHPGVKRDGSRFAGTPLEALAVFAILAAVLAVGIATLAYGVWQIRTGRRDIRAVAVASAVLTAMVLVAALI